MHTLIEFDHLFRRHSILITRQAVVRKRMEAGKEAKAAYGKRLAEYRHELKERHAAEVAKKKAKKN